MALSGGYSRSRSCEALPCIIQVPLGFAGLLVAEGELASDPPNLRPQLCQVNHGRRAASPAAAVALAGAATGVRAAGCSLLLLLLLLLLLHLLEVGNPGAGLVHSRLCSGQLRAQARVLGSE